MSFQTVGINDLRIRINALNGSVDVATEEMRQLAFDIREKARDMAPIDYGDLKKSLKIRNMMGQDEKSRNDKGQAFTGSRRQFIIYADNNLSLSHPTIDAQTVGDYVWEVHEYMGWSGHEATFMPSKDSVKAGEAHGVDAGGKFLERAVNEYRDSAESRVTAAFNASLHQK